MAGGVFGCVVATLLDLLSGSEKSALDFAATTGPRPTLPLPRQSVIPTVHVAPAKGWSDGAAPVPAPGLRVNAFASDLKHPRWVYVLPNGDVLVAESNGPGKRPKEFKGITAKVMREVTKCVGDGDDSADQITLLRDTDGDGVADQRSIFLRGLRSPFGMALVGNDLYVANTDGVARFPYTAGATEITASPTSVASLPAGERNHHWTKNLIASRDGKKLYATVGSNSDHQDYGSEEETGRARIWEIDLATGGMEEFAKGLRNPNGMGWEPVTGVLWTVVNERDALGSDLVPDYLTSATRGDSYGWPYCYYGTHLDTRVVPAPGPDFKCDAKPPDYALGNHVAPLGLAFSEGAALPPQFMDGAFIGQHGSWNRRPFSGYSVVFVAFAGGKPKPQAVPVDVLVGFVDEAGKARGRPVGVAIDKSGALLVADDVGGKVWRVTKAP
jgi:glucose/arabinose dehydrogenase